MGSDTHATIEVNFLTTRPIEKRGGVLSTFACACRLEAVVSDEIKHNLINLNLLCWKGWRPTLYEGLLTAEQRGITLYPHLYGDCTWLESVTPEHPSAMLASVSSHVGRSVGWSGDFSTHEKQHEFSRHEHDFSHEQHDFPQHGGDFSREQHEQTHVEQSQLPHVGGNSLGRGAVGQSSCDSSGVQLVGQSSCDSSGVQLVGQSSCGSSEVQLVGRLPARVVELLQSSTVGKPCQDRRLCQDHVGTPLSSGPTTSSGLGPTLGAQGSLRGSVNESEFLQRSACVHGLVGRSVGRSVGCAEGQLQSWVGCAEGQLQSSVGCAEGQLQSSVGCAGEQLQSPVGRAEVQLQPPSSAQEEAQAGALREDEAISEVGSPYSSHGGRGGELRGGRCRDGSPERVFSCEATGGAKGTTATEWHGDRGHNRCRDDGASHHHGRGLVSTLPVATGGVELPRHAGAQPNGILRLLPPVREVAFSGAPAGRRPHETDGAVVASRQTCFGDPSRSLHGSREVRNAYSSTPPSVVKQHGKERVLQMEFFEAQEGVYTGEIPAGVRVGEARGSSSGQCGQTCSTSLDRGATGEEAQEDRATSTQVGEEEGEAKGDQAVAGYPWCCSSLFGPDGEDGRCCAAFEARDLCSGCGERGRKLGRLERSEGISSGGAVHSTKVSSASVDATYASQGRADVGCGNGVNGPSSTSAGSGANGSSCASAAFGGTAYVQLDPQLLQHWTSGDLLFAFGRVLPYKAPAGPGFTSRAGRVGSCQGRGPGSAGEGEDVVFASAATLGGSSGADSRAGGIIDNVPLPAPPALPPSVAWVIMPPPRPPRREASPPPSPR